MKKIFVLIFVVTLVSIPTFFGIKRLKQNKQIKPNIVVNFKSETIVNIEDKVYGGIFSHSDDFTEFLIQDPSNIGGVKIAWEGENQQIYFDGVKKDSKKFIIPEDSFLNLVVKILSQIPSIELVETSNDGKYTTLEGAIEKHKFTFNCDDDGYIKEINIPCKNSSITFEYETQN